MVWPLDIRLKLTQVYTVYQTFFWIIKINFQKKQYFEEQSKGRKKNKALWMGVLKR